MFTISIRSTNFGAPGNPFTFSRAGNRFCILQGCVTFDPPNEDYQAAEELRITLSDEIGFRSSRDTSVILACGESAPHNGTILRARIENYRNIVIEKLSDFDVLSGPFRIYVCTAFVSVTIDGRITELNTAPAIRFSNTRG